MLRRALLRARGRALSLRVRGTAAMKYECLLCKYVYDPALGDPGGRIPPGTPFEKLPDDWLCPLCGAGKEFFAPKR